MIKIVNFKISLKLKQKYLFEKLYFLKIYHFYSLGVVCIFQTFLILSKEYLYPLLKITMKENLYSIISYRQPHRVCNYDFLLKWKIQKLLIMYIGGSSIILTKKFFLHRIQTCKTQMRSLISYPLNRTINLKQTNYFNMIKIAHFNISLKLKQKYLFKKLYLRSCIFF